MKTLLCAVALLGLTGCDYEVLSTAELAQLRKDAEIGRSIGRFTWQEETGGPPTNPWTIRRRFDRVTGELCTATMNAAAIASLKEQHLSVVWCS
jgi:hypothetical protein